MEITAVSKKIKIGNVEINSCVSLSPLAGITDFVLRQLIREYSNNCLLTTEMISSEALVQRPDCNISFTNEKEAPVAFQIEGHKPDLMAKSAKILENKATIIDINMGCPIKKIVNGNDGCSLMKNPQLAKDIVVAVKESELEMTLENLKGRVRMVVTDSQIFGKVSEIVPDEIPLTSFSILMARYKGNLDSAVKGAAALSSLRGGERILISEGCTHHRQCGDIGTEKLPMWIRRYTGKDFMFEHTMGTGFPEDLSPYSLVIHCGGCMLTEREMEVRYRKAEEAEIPITNYGTIIAYMNGILERSLSLFPSVLWHRLLPELYPALFVHISDHQPGSTDGSEPAGHGCRTHGDK